jgi:hypothetical protein
MIIFASMEPDMINLSRTNADGVHSLRAFMEFAKKGNEPLLFENRNKNKHANSVTIIPKIRKALEDQGYRVKTNVGSSEFKIDLAVIDKNNDNIYLAAILLDGYRYANRSTTRDRNKQSELVLGRLGWNIIKVWSVEWWHNENKQIQDIISRVQEIEEQSMEEKRETNETKTNKQDVFQQKLNSLTIHEKEEKADNIFKPAILDKVNLPNEFYYTREGLPTIRQQIKKIIDEEAPVSFSRLTKEIINAWGFSRSGAKLEAVIQDSLNRLMIYETKEEKGKFLWKDKEQFETYHIFRHKERYRRALEDISKVEFANGVNNLMKTALRLPKSDLTRELSKQLGYSRTTSKTERYVQEAIDYNIKKGFIAENSDGYVEFIG